MATPAQLAALSTIGRQSVRFYENANEIGTIGTYHRASVGRLRSQGRQSIVVIDGEIGGNVPPVPGNVSASTLSSSSIRVTCDDVANETGYKWYRSTTNDSGTAALVGTTGMNVASFTDSGLLASTTYYYWVRATNANGDSAFSTVASTATSAASGGSGVLGNYLGFFRLQKGTGQHIRMISRDAHIAAHPTSGKMYYVNSGPGLANLGNSSGAAGHIAELTIPSIGSLTSDIGTTVQADGLSNPVEVLGDFSSASGLAINYTRIGGVAYSSTTNKLWVNFARYYHTSPDAVESLCEFHPSTFAKIGNYKLAATAPKSEPNGVISCLHGTPLASYGDFMTSIYWGQNNAGPRQNIIGLGAGDSLNHTRLLYHTLASPWQNASLKCPSGAGAFIGSDFVFPFRNGIAGWYGGPDGYDGSGVNFIAPPENWLPDVWSSSKGYHAPPYRAYLVRVPTSQLVEVLQATRAVDQCDYTLEDITDHMVRTTVDSSGRTRYQSLIAQGLVKQDGYFFMLEWNADTTQSAFESPHVVHVWSGDN